MRQVRWIILLAFTVVFAVACPPGGNEGGGNGGTEPAKDLKTTLADRETAAYDAWAKKDGKFFEGFLADNYSGQGAAGPNWKSKAVKSISESDCDVKSYKIVESEITEYGNDAVLLITKSEGDYTCEGKKGPSPNYGASLYVKNGDVWQAVYHQNVGAAKPEKEEGEDKAAAEDGEEKPAADAEKKEEPAAEDAEKKEEAAAAETPPAGDAEMAKALSEIETGLWEAWKKKDGDAFEKALSAHFKEISPKGTSDRAATIKAISENKCEVKSNELADFNATKVNDDLAVLRYKGTVDGTCDGKPMPKTVFITTIFVKDGDAWKPAFHMETPGAE